MIETWLSLWLRASQALAIDFLKIWTLPLDRFRPEHDLRSTPLAPATKTNVMGPRTLQARDRKSSAVAKRRSKRHRRKVHLSRRGVKITEARAPAKRVGR
jgi:hypothetical protein